MDLSILSFVVVPALLGLGALIAAAALVRTPRDREQTPLRLLFSYLLLLPAFAIGTCYAAVFTYGVVHGSRQPPIENAVGIGFGLAAAVAILYALRVRALPRSRRDLAEAFEVEVKDDGRNPVALVLVVLGAISLVAAILAFAS